MNKLLNCLGKCSRLGVSYLEVHAVAAPGNTFCSTGTRSKLTQLTNCNRDLKLADVNIKCASTYFRYGAALFYKAQDEQDVFGSSLQAATAHEDAEEADAAEDEASGKDPFCKLGLSIVGDRSDNALLLPTAVVVQGKHSPQCQCARHAQRQQNKMLQSF